MLEHARGDEVVLIDGVKAIDAAGWTLVVPDAEEPVTHVYAEGDSHEAAVERARQASSDIAAILEAGRPLQSS